MNSTPAKTITSACSRRRLLGELQAIAHKVRQILNLRFLVIVRQDDGIHLPLQARDLLFEIEVRQGGWTFDLCRSDHGLGLQLVLSRHSHYSHRIRRTQIVRPCSARLSAGGFATPRK